MNTDELLRVVVHPSPHARELDYEPPSSVAFAYLLAGQVDKFNERAEAAGLPTFDQAAARMESQGLSALVTALVLILQGDRTALDFVRNLAQGDAQTGISTVAVVLESLLVSDGGRPDLAIEPLQGRLERAEGELERLLLVCQLGLRTLEAGQFGLTDQLVELNAGPAESGSIETDALKIIAEHNAFQHRWLARSEVTGTHSRRSTSVVLASVDATATEASDRFLADTFKSFFASPYTRTYSIGSLDQVDHGLSAAIFRSELLGDFEALRRFRGLLGKYHLMNEAGRSAKATGLGFSLLRRAHDANAISEAGRVFRDVGPLEALREAASRSILVPWFPLELRSHLALIGVGSVVFEDQEVEQAARRLIDNFDDLTKHVPGAGWVTDEATKALASVAYEAGPDTQEAVAELVLRLLESPPDPLLHQSLPRVIHAISWDRLPAAMQQGASKAIERFLAPPTDRAFAAVALCRALFPTHRDAISAAVLSAYRETQSPLAGELVTEFEIEVDTDEQEVLAEQYRVALDQNRHEASQGRYSMGGMNLGVSASLLALKSGSRALFQALSDYLFDPDGSPTERRAIATVLARNAERVPEEFAKRFREPLPVARAPFPIFGSQADIEVAALELALAWGGGDASSLVPVVVGMITSEDSTVRLDAAKLLSRNTMTLPSDVTSTALLTLAADREPTVRSQAAYGLSFLVSSSNSALISERVWALANEPGAATPDGVWSGLTQARRQGVEVPQAIADRAPDVARHHLARNVRRAAHAFLDAIVETEGDGRP